MSKSIHDQVIYAPVERKKGEIAVDPALQLAKKSISIDNNNSTVPIAMSGVYRYKYDWLDDKELRKAKRNQPGDL
jgi:hypothetical protein